MPFGRDYLQESSYNTLLTIGLRKLVKTIHLPDIQAMTYFSDLQFSCLANVGVCAERSSDRARQRLKTNLEGDVVSGGSGGRK